MAQHGRRAFLIVLALSSDAGIAAQPGQAAQPGGGCVDFKWDVATERILFAGTSAATTAGKNAKSAPKLAPDRLYSIRLAPQEDVHLQASPAARGPDPGAHAGVMTLNVAAAGRYRVSVDTALWIDVISHGRLVEASDYQAQHDCAAPHKIVQFELAEAGSFILQLSNSKSGVVLLSVTASPARTR